VKTLGKDGTVHTEDWKTADTDANTLVVGPAQGGVVKIQVDPSDTGIGTPASTLRRVVVRLHYADPAHRVLDEQVMVFRDATVQVWSIARADATASAYSYDVEYVRSDGNVVTLPGQEGRIGGSNDFLFVPPAPAPVPTPPAPPAPPTPPPPPIPAGPGA
jgi:hypothetical protein